MSSTYNYQTGKMNLGFSLKKIWGMCKKNDPNTLIGVPCFSCEHYKGRRENFIFCEYYQQDDNGAEHLRSTLYEELREKAIKALDYL